MHTKFWQGKRILVTGHTGFKGSWLCMWLHQLGAEVAGYALEPPTNPSLYELARVDQLVTSVIADVRDLPGLTAFMQEFQPEIVMHLAAQPLVRESYKNPVETYEINVIGSVNLLEAVRRCQTVKAVVNVTSDKCYENREISRGYLEEDPLGGYDPYASSKACAELVTAAYRNSFFSIKDYPQHGVAIASARAGNVIGGGDWAADRLVPDIIRAFLKGEELLIRNPSAVRPWQHVLVPLSGYLLLAEKLFSEGPDYAEGWNFGPLEQDTGTVEWIVQKMCERWKSASYRIENQMGPHEAAYLKLDSAKAKERLGWLPGWTLETALDKVMEWVEVYKCQGDLRQECLKQIKEYTSVKR